MVFVKQKVLHEGRLQGINENKTQRWQCNRQCVQEAMGKRVGKQNYPVLLGVTKRTWVMSESWSRKACDIFSEEILEIM